MANMQSIARREDKITKGNLWTGKNVEEYVNIRNGRKK